MARYFTDGEKAEIQGWLLELREIVTPNEFPTHRQRACKLVALLDQRPTHPACVISYEYKRVRKIWRRLDAQSE
jgi:hypothetical protein